MCVKGAAALPPQLAKPISEACSNATDAVAKIPGQVISGALAKAQNASNAICDAITGAAAKAMSKTTLETTSSFQQLAGAAGVTAAAAGGATGGVDFMKVLTDAIAQAKAELKKIMDQAVKAAAGKITEAVTVALNKGLKPLQATLKSSVDKAITAATGGLDSMKTSLAKIPKSISSSVGQVCNMLPAAGGVDLKTVCSKGVQGIVKNATGMVGKMCQTGVDAMIGVANKSLGSATSAVEGAVGKLSGACKKITGLPDPLGASIQGACTNVSTTLSKMPGQILGNATATLKTATSAVCKALSSMAQASRHGLQLKSLRFQQLQAAAGGGMDFTKALTDAIAQAKAELKTIMDQAVKAAAGKITEAVTVALNKGLKPLQAKIQAQADKAITAATGGLGSLKTSLGKIPTAIKSTVGQVCQALPAAGGVDLKTVCSNGVVGIVKNATGMVGKMCQTGVDAMIGVANKSLGSASAAVEGAIQKLAGACKTAGTGLPDPLGPSIQGACTNVTSTLSKMPTAIIGNSIVKIKDAASAVCKTLSSLQARHGARLDASSLQQLQADAGGSMDFSKALTDAVTQAKGELKKIMDQVPTLLILIHCVASIADFQHCLRRTMRSANTT